MPAEQPNIDFTGSIPARYDEFLGPVIFTPYAEDLTVRVSTRLQAGLLLETACGTGLVTRALDRALPPAVRIVATDLNDAMLTYAHSRMAPTARIEWRTADAAALSFPDAAFDAVVNQFGLMFVPDKALAFREARRVLKGGGTLVFNVWDRMEDNPFARIAHTTIGGFFETDPPTFYQVPFGFSDRASLESHLRDARFTDLSLATVKKDLHAASAHAFARGLVEGNPVVAAIRDARVPAEDVVSAVAQALAREGGDTPFRSTMQAVVGTARA